jgi:hypothetical protein
MYTARVWIRHALGPGTLTFLCARASMLDTADAQTLRETGFKISLNAPGLQSVGVDFPPGMPLCRASARSNLQAHVFMRAACILTGQEAGAWPEDVKNPPTILVFEPTATMSKALQSEMKVSPKPHQHKQICARDFTHNKDAPTQLLLWVRCKFSPLNDFCPPVHQVCWACD